MVDEQFNSYGQELRLALQSTGRYGGRPGKSPLRIPVDQRSNYENLTLYCGGALLCQLQRTLGLSESLKPRERNAPKTTLILESDTRFGSQDEVDLVLSDCGKVIEAFLEEGAGHFQTPKSARAWLRCTHDVDRFDSVNDRKRYLDPPRFLFGPRLV